MAKAEVLGIDRSFEVIRANIFDIAGIRITCAFLSDNYVLSDLLTDSDPVQQVCHTRLP